MTEQFSSLKLDDDDTVVVVITKKGKAYAVRDDSAGTLIPAKCSIAAINFNSNAEDKNEIQTYMAGTNQDIMRTWAGLVETNRELDTAVFLDTFSELAQNIEHGDVPLETLSAAISIATCMVGIGLGSNMYDHIKNKKNNDEDYDKKLDNLLRSVPESGTVH